MQQGCDTCKESVKCRRGAFTKEKKLEAKVGRQQQKLTENAGTIKQLRADLRKQKAATQSANKTILANATLVGDAKNKAKILDYTTTALTRVLANMSGKNVKQLKEAFEHQAWGLERDRPPSVQTFVLPRKFSDMKKITIPAKFIPPHRRSP